MVARQKHRGGHTPDVKHFPALHVIADNAAVEANDFAHTAAALMHCGCERLAFHVRAHGMPGGLFHAAVATLPDTARETGAWLVINDRVDIALAAGIRGVLLGQRSLPVSAVRALAGSDATIGYSAHAVDEAAIAVGDTADFVLLGTIFETASHPGRAGSGVQLVRTAAAQVGVPIVAIGGITLERVQDVMTAGASGVAVLSGIWQAEEPVSAVQEYLDALARVPQEK